MLDKSPERTVRDGMDLIRSQFERNVPSIVACSDPFDKAEFLIRLIDSAGSPVIFVDLDRLYSGYVESGMIRQKDNMSLLLPEREDWERDLADVIARASKEKFLVVIDSLNGVYNMFDGPDAGRFINSCLVLLASTARQAGSSVIITAMVRKREDRGWVLLPGGRKLVKSAQTGMFYAKKTGEHLALYGLRKSEPEKVLIAKI